MMRIFSGTLLYALMFSVLLSADEEAFKEGVRLFKEGEYEEALKAFRSVLKERGDAVVHYNIALTLYKLGRYGEAVKEYEEAVKMKKDYDEARLGLVCALAMAGRIKDAAEALKSAVFVKRSRDRLVSLIIVAERFEDRSSEEMLLSLLVALSPDDVAMRLRLADLRISLGRYREALVVLDVVKRLSADNGFSYLLSSYALKGLGRLKEAIDEAEVALALGERRALRILAQLYEDVGLPRVAAEYTLELIEETGSVSLVVKVAQLYLDADSPEDAVEVLKRVTLKSPKALLVMASALVKLGRFDDALGVVDDCLREEESVQARLLRAEVLIQLKRYGDAETEYRRVLESESYNRVALRNLAFVLQRLGRDGEALEILRRLEESEDE